MLVGKALPSLSPVHVRCAHGPGVQGGSRAGSCGVARGAVARDVARGAVRATTQGKGRLHANSIEVIGVCMSRAKGAMLVGKLDGLQRGSALWWTGGCEVAATSFPPASHQLPASFPPAP